MFGIDLKRFALLLVALLLVVGSSLYGSSERYVEEHALDDIKYSLRLFDTTFEYKTLFDKAVSQEGEGFFGYFAADSAFRAYQDLIRMIFEEILQIAVPKEFHFLAVPLYPKRTLQSLDDIEKAFFVDAISAYAFANQCLPLHIALYANHKSLGFCPIRAFGKKALATTDDLVWLLHFLEMDAAIFDQAKKLAQEASAGDDHLLLQFFDRSHELGSEAYTFADKVVYPATLLGYPFDNASISEYRIDSAKTLPPQFFLLLHDAYVLNIKSPFSVIRYAKIQPSKLKNYEESLRLLVGSASYNKDRVEEYCKQYKISSTLQNFFELSL